MAGAGSATGDAAVPGPDEAGERWARVALTRIGEPGDAVLGAWVEDVGAVEAVRALHEDRRPAPLTATRWAGLRLRAGRAHPERDLERVAAVGGRFLCPGDAEWPGQLDDLGPARPFGLWVRGAPSLRFLALRSVAVVGARACTDYGAHVAAELAGDLAERGWTVVSGAAYGIDGAAHQGVLRAGGPTVAVLACGVDACYPAGHRDLLDRVAAGGLVVSELPPGDHPTRGRFLQRNRVLAALSRGTVVVEAARRSGALSTARHATRMGRPAMGVPGPVHSAHSEGVHELLRTDGVLVTRAPEVVELVGRIGEVATAPEGWRLPRDLLYARSARVLDALPRGAGAEVAEVAVGACTSEADAAARLHELHALGFVRRSGPTWWLAPSGKGGGTAGGTSQRGSADATRPPGGIAPRG